MVEVLCCWDLWWKLFSLWMRLIPIAVGFCDCKPGAMAPVAASLLFRVLSTPGSFQCQWPESGAGVESMEYLTGKHWGGVSCWNYHVPLSQWWEAPREGKLSLAQWSVVSMCAWAGVVSTLGHGLWIHLNWRKMLPCFPRFCISNVSCDRSTYFFPFSLICIFKNVVHNAVFPVFFLQKPVVLEVNYKAVNSTVMKHMVLSVAFHLLFQFMMYLLYPTLPFLAQITVIDRIAQKMGKRKLCLAARDLPAVLRICTPCLPMPDTSLVITLLTPWDVPCGITNAPILNGYLWVSICQCWELLLQRCSEICYF